MTTVATIRSWAIAPLCALLLFAGATPASADEVTVFGQRLHYVDVGRGPVVVLLHGLWGGTNEWQPVIDALSSDYRVIAVDALGFHGSDKPEVQYHNALLAQFLTGFLQTLDLREVTLMGHAMGANLATFAAVHHPDRINRLVLVDGAGYRNPDRDLSAPLSSRMLAFRRIATGSTLASTESFLKRRVKDEALITPAWTETAFSMWLESARAISDMLREGGDLSEEEMQTISLPTLVIWGDEDAVFPIANAHRLIADIARAELQIIEGSGHLPQLEQTAAFLAAVRPFLSANR